MSNKIFERIGLDRPKYSAFDLSREQKLSFNMGELIPTYIEEVLPGDQFNVKTETLLRVAPMVFPIMHRVNVFLHYFFVPHRIVWNEWEEFITGGVNGTSTATPPKFTMAPPTSESPLTDYLGIPNVGGTNTGFQISQLPYRAYQKIYSDYYRDQTLQAEIDVHTASTATLTTLRQRCWEKDYFTSALPFAQRGVTPNLPIGIEYHDQSKVVKTDGTNPAGGQNIQTSSTPTGLVRGSGGDALRIENIEALTLTINQLRETSAIQRFMEKMARTGSRYIEYIKATFPDARITDQRLQRAEYLGGGMQPIMISEVLNTTGTATAPQGDMAGHGISVGTTNEFNKSFEEHGYVIGILSVLPRTAYQNGIPRHFRKDDRFDFYQPEFANLGEQEVFANELFYDAADNTFNVSTFGYQQRYAEYKYGMSTVHGEFRSGTAGGLDRWHMARDIADASAAVLNSDFVTADPTRRIFAVEDETVQTLWCQLYHNVKARRPMPYFAKPSLR